MAARVVLLSIPQLRRRDVTPGGLSSLESLAATGGLADLVPAFPGLTASAFATLVTGAGPYEHGVVGNAYLDPATRRVTCSPLPDSAVQSPRIWDRLRAARPDARTLLWFGPTSEGAAVDRAAWIDRDGSLAIRPTDLGAELAGSFGPFPGPGADPKGEPPRLESTAWMLRTAAAAIAADPPDLAVIRVPYLGQVARRFGPDGREASRAVVELQAVLGPFLTGLPPGTTVVAATESVTTPVSSAVFPNQILRALGLLALRPAAGGGLDLDLDQCAAFALADHQICHVYLNDRGQEGAVASAFSGPHGDGIAHVASGAQRAALGLDHPRAGEIILIACADRWFAPGWWKTPEEMPRHPDQACGLIQPSPGGPLKPTHVLGSVGAPPPNDQYHGVLVASDAAILGPDPRLSARDLTPRILDALIGDAGALA